MGKNKFEEITEPGLKELELQWPGPETIYELKIPRTDIKDMRNGQTKPRIFHLYFDFLYLDVFPLIEKLEQEAGIKYWHILNHGEFTDLRMAIENSDQMADVKKVIDKESFPEESFTKWSTYKGPNLGSRLGCQALMRLYHAQSKFVHDVVNSIYWIKDIDDQKGEEKSFLIDKLINQVPIYTSHMLLNIFPGDPFYEAISHMNEAQFRLENIVNHLPDGASQALQKQKEAVIVLSNSITQMNPKKE